ncbi:MAG: D-tyrosyl-tRNA(Tyr) deacylase [Nitrospirae bacterium]|nr:MAG: D-tyrosyl-tRNA(Tyr) deacylase [Nitrospirota bacterium]
MRAVVQRVARAEVRAGGEARSIGPGLLVLLAVVAGDTEADLAWVADKVAGLRIFENEAGKMDRSVGQVGGAVMVVSQFTLAASLAKGRRPDFTGAERPELAAPMVDRFAERLRRAGLPVVQGFFGAHMAVELVNDGPVTLWLDSRSRK